MAGNKVKRMAEISLMAAIVVVLAFVPFLGFIPLGVIKATTVHIPVIIGAILLGPKAGAILGGVFGLTSIIQNTMAPAVVSFVFSPFIPVPGSDKGSMLSLVVALVPRILIGVFAGLIYKVMEKRKINRALSCGVAAFVGSMANTLLVMGGIWLFFGKEYAAAKNLGLETLSTFILGVIATQGMAEMAVAVVLAVLIAVPLTKVMKRA